jgi:hypothetical protein
MAKKGGFFEGAIFRPVWSDHGICQDDSRAGRLMKFAVLVTNEVGEKHETDAKVGFQFHLNLPNALSDCENSVNQLCATVHLVNLTVSAEVFVLQTFALSE